MRRIIFYSWQSDLPNRCNRGVIEAALKNVAASIAADNAVAVEPVLDRDTQNVPGAPDIASTIFAKITASDVFVADVSISTRAEGQRPTPNPNVLVELGYALKTLGHERVILVFNSAFGKVEELPFDLRSRRAYVYEVSPDSGEKATARRNLERSLDVAIRSALQHAPVSEPSATLANSAIAAIEEARPNRSISVRKALDQILKRLIELEPKKHRDGGTVEELIEGINQTQEIVAEFSKIAEAAAVMDDETIALAIVRWFGKIFERYNLPRGFSGTYNRADHDYYRFLGHELFVTLVAFVIKEQKWDMLPRLLDEPIPVAYIESNGPGAVDWNYASEYLVSLDQESKKTQRISVHADLLNKRHSNSGGLSAVLPIEDFVEADYFLYLLSQAADLAWFWRAWSCVYLNNSPAFVRDSVKKRFAERIVTALGLKSIEEYKVLMKEKGGEISKLFGFFWDFPIRPDTIEQIGTR